jgi:hypothetical protein
MIEKIRQWIAGTGISEKALAVILAIISFLVVNAAQTFDYQKNLLWTDLMAFFIIISVAFSAYRGKNGYERAQLPIWNFVGWYFLTYIPILNAYPAMYAGRNWARKILENNG